MNGHTYTWRFVTHAADAASSCEYISFYIVITQSVCVCLPLLPSQVQGVCRKVSKQCSRESVECQPQDSNCLSASSP